MTGLTCSLCGRPERLSSINMFATMSSGTMRSRAELRFGRHRAEHLKARVERQCKKNAVRVR